MHETQVGILLFFGVVFLFTTQVLERDRLLIAAYVLAGQWLVAAVSLKLQEETCVLTWLVAVGAYCGVGFGAWRWLVRDWEGVMTDEVPFVRE